MLYKINTIVLTQCHYFKNSKTNTHQNIKFQKKKTSM